MNVFQPSLGYRFVCISCESIGRERREDQFDSSCAGASGNINRGLMRTRSTFSSDSPDDSYKKKYTTSAPRRLHDAKTKPYRKLMARSMKGVKNARRKF